MLATRSFRPVWHRVIFLPLTSPSSPCPSKCEDVAIESVNVDEEVEYEEVVEDVYDAVLSAASFPQFMRTVLKKMVDVV